MQPVENKGSSEFHPIEYQAFPLGKSNSGVKRNEGMSKFLPTPPSTNKQNKTRIFLFFFAS